MNADHPPHPTSRTPWTARRRPHARPRLRRRDALVSPSGLGARRSLGGRRTFARLALALACGFSALAPAPARGQGACPSGERPRGHLGITIACDCTVGPGWGSDWTFRSPIYVSAVERDGPAYGLLWSGDEILAANGAPVTAASGSLVLETLRPGQRVRLTVRRGGEERTVRVTAREICPHDPRAIGTYAPGPLPARAAPRQGRETAAPAPEAPAERPPRSGAAEPAPLPDGPPDVRPEGWLGLAFACTGCGWARAAGDEAPSWESSEPPVVYAVAPEGPAARAGVQAGDVLLSVEGREITAEAGGRALGAVRPGDRLRLAVRRGDDVVDVVVEATARPEAEGDGPRPLRYAGEIAGVRVEVSGDPPSDVSVTSDGERLVIVVGGTVIRLTAPH